MMGLTGFSWRLEAGFLAVFKEGHREALEENSHCSEVPEC